MKGQTLQSNAIKKPYEQKNITDCLIAADLGRPFGSHHEGDEFS
jgi:hypothetical protein